MKDYNRNEVEILLKSLGMRNEECQHWAGVLCKWNAFNFLPDCEVRSYLRFFRNLLDNPHERMWSDHSYMACHYMWQELAKIWKFRKSLPRHRRV